MFLRNFFKGIVSVLTIGSSPLYRYPYRSSAEGMAGDWRRIGKDIMNAMEKAPPDEK